MSANDNMDSLASRARSQRDDAEHEEGTQRSPDPQPGPLSQTTPTHHSPSLLPANYLQSSQGNFYDNQKNQATAPAFPASFLAPTPAAPNIQSAGAAAQTLASAAPSPNPNLAQNAAPSIDSESAPPTPYIQDRRPLNLPMDATVQMPGRSRDNIPIDCTVQMRGRTRGNIQIEQGIPWEKSAEPAEEEEKILALPVPPPPPSSTNNRLPAMTQPVTKEMLQNHVEQAASGNFNAAKLDSIPTPRQAVRYKPATPTSEQVRPKMVDPVTPKKRRSEQAPSSSQSPSTRSPQSYSEDQSPQAQPAQKRRPSNDFYESEQEEERQEKQPAESKRVRINPKLLNPSGSSSSARSPKSNSNSNSNSDSEYDTEFTPRRYSSLTSDGSVSKFSWSEMQYLLKFYFREVKSLFINPQDFFLAHVEDTTLGEPITFMILSGGIAAVFMTLSGNVGDAISTLFGTSAYAIIAGIAVHYAMQWMGVSEGELKSCFKILAYSQAPLLVSWIKLGTIPVGWICAFGYSMFLCVVGLEQVFEMDRQRAIVIVAVVSLVIRGLLHLIGL